MRSGGIHPEPRACVSITWETVVLFHAVPGNSDPSLLVRQSCDIYHAVDLSTYLR